MLTFKKGETFPLPPQSAEGVLFSVEPYTMLLIYYFKKPTAEEQEAFKKQDVNWGVTVLRNTIFVFSKFGSLSWMDTSYSTHLSSSRKELPELAEGQGYAIDAFLVDQESNICVEHRLLHLDTQTSRKWKAILEEEQKREDFTEAGYQEKVQEVYANYSTRDLVKLAACRCRCRG